jgi:hypothetical protein
VRADQLRGRREHLVGGNERWARANVPVLVQAFQLGAFARADHLKLITGGGEDACSTECSACSLLAAIAMSRF